MPKLKHSNLQVIGTIFLLFLALVLLWRGNATSNQSEPALIAQVYFDGTYKGIAPVEFKKQAGEHVIILRLDGYETKMYTIDVVSDGEDMEINLPAMLETDDE